MPVSIGPDRLTRLAAGCSTDGSSGQQQSSGSRPGSSNFRPRPRELAHVHRHSGIALHTPASVHYGTATEIREQRQVTLLAAFEANSIRFRHRPPMAPKIPEVAWINKPVREEVAQNS
jgi:putative transposase